MGTRAARAKSAGASAARKTPDVIGRRGRVEAVAQMLAQIQRQILNLAIDQTANGLADDAIAPGYAQESERTVAKERQRLKDAEARIVDEYSDLMPEIEKLIEQSEKKQQ